MKHAKPATASAATPSAATLRRRRAKIPETLPPLEQLLRGSLFEREICCGKPTCRCAKGPGHPILCVGVTFPGGRTQQVTVPRDLARTVRLWIRNYQRWWQAIEDVSAINRRLLQLREIPAGPAPRRSSGTAARVGRSTSRRHQGPSR